MPPAGPAREGAAVAIGRLVATLMLGILLTSWAVLSLPGTRTYPGHCPGSGQLALVLPGACAHEDVAPPGVDPHEPVRTSELREREGAGERAYEAAEELGVAAPQSVNVSDPSVPCEGDGTSGYRVQPMYVVESG